MSWTSAAWARDKPRYSRNPDRHSVLGLTLLDCTDVLTWHSAECEYYPTHMTRYACAHRPQRILSARATCLCSGQSCLPPLGALLNQASLQQQDGPYPG